MKKFRAFTLAEILIVFVIIGIIATIGINTVKPWEKSLKYSYSRIYNALGLAVYNAVVNGNRPTHNFADTASILCNDLAYYMNNVETHCGEAPVLRTANAVSFRNKTPHLVLSNGVKLWIGAFNAAGKAYKVNIPLNKSYTSGTIPTATSADSTAATPANSDTIIYYIVYADLNGNRKPNSPIWSAKQAADIVAFAVTNQFVVVPLGYPIVDRRYFAAHVMRPMNNEDNGEDIDIPSDPMTFYEAATYAYGRYMKSNGDALSYQIEFNKAAFKGTTQADYFTVKNCDRIGNNTGSCVNNGETGSKFVRYYQAQPGFNGDAITFCGLNNCGAADGSSSQYCEPICYVKIYDYH